MRRLIETTVSAIDTAEQKVSPASLSFPASNSAIIYSPIEIIDKIFNSASDLVQMQSASVHQLVYKSSTQLKPYEICSDTKKAGKTKTKKTKKNCRKNYYL